MHKTEKAVRRIAEMDRTGLVRMLRGMACKFELDFTDEYLQDVSIERLRHIAVAACLHANGRAKRDTA